MNGSYSFDLSNRVVLITGASSGIGKQLAQTLARNGAKVVLAARRAELLDDVRAAIQADGGLAEAVPMDVVDEASTVAAFDACEAAFGPKQTLALSDTLVSELLAADHVAISTPVHNYNVPANLKAWIDQIVRKGVTLGFDGEGLLANRKATVLMASGGVYTHGSPIRDRDVAHLYLRVILKVIGIDDFTLVTGGGAKAVEMGEQTMAQFVANLQPDIAAAAA